MVAARGSSKIFAPASSTVTQMPRQARLSAAVRPMGPAPAISTRSVDAPAPDELCADECADELCAKVMIVEYRQVDERHGSSCQIDQGPTQGPSQGSRALDWFARPDRSHHTVHQYRR